MKLLIMQCSPAPTTSSILGPNIFLSTPVLKYPQSMFFPTCDRQSFTHKTTGKIMVVDVLNLILPGNLTEDEIGGICGEYGNLRNSAKFWLKIGRDHLVYPVLIQNGARNIKYKDVTIPNRFHQT
jgi:hypothetical protein